MPLIPAYTGFAATPNLSESWLGGRRQLLAEREHASQASSESARIALGYAQLQNQKELAQMEFAAKAEQQARDNLLRQQELEIRKAYNEQMMGLREEDLMRKLQESEARREQAAEMMAMREAGLTLRGQEQALREQSFGLREQEQGLRQQAMDIQAANLGLSRQKFAAAEPTRIATENRKQLRDEISELRGQESKEYGKHISIADQVQSGNTREYDKLGAFERGTVDKIISNRKRLLELEERLSAITESQTRAFVPPGMTTAPGTTTTNTLPRILRKTPR